MNSKGQIQWLKMLKEKSIQKEWKCDTEGEIAYSPHEKEKGGGRIKKDQDRYISSSLKC